MDDNEVKISKFVPSSRIPYKGKVLTFGETIHTENYTRTFRYIAYEEVVEDNLLYNTSYNIDNIGASSLVDSLANFSLGSSLAEEVPMEIDSSGNLSASGSIKQSTPPDEVRQRYHKNVKSSTINTTAHAKTVLYQSPRKQFSYFCMFLTIAILLLSIAMFYVIYSKNSFIFVNQETQLTNIKRDLSLVQFQPSVVHIIIETFKRIDLWHKPIKVLPFIGSSGVGKTFTANILRRNFVSLLVYQLNANNLANTDEHNSIFNTLSTTSCNLIIVDDLTTADTKKVIDFIAKVPENRLVLIIPIFNVQTTTDGWIYTIHTKDINFIRDTFDKSGFYYELVFYNTLTVEMVKKWLHLELHKRNVDEKMYHQLTQVLIDPEQVERKGLKGIDTKLVLALANI